MSEHCHLNGEGHKWRLISHANRQFWCSDCGAFGHERRDTKEMEWEAPRLHFGHRKSTSAFLKGLPKKKTRFDHDDPVD